VAGDVTLWESFVLGIVQGATEFLPVSSSGHLVIVQTLMGVNASGVVFEVAVHLATLVSILLVYRTRVADLAKGALTGDRAAQRYIGLLVVATLPAGVVGVLWKDVIEGLFEIPAAPAIALLFTGAFLWSSRAPLESAKGTVPGWGAALLIGVAQSFALVPGISRSGATVVAALWLGIEAREAAAFSFLMAVPAIAGAAVLQLPDLTAGTGPGWGVLLVGAVTAGVTGVLAIRTFVAVLARRSFHLFAPYCWLVGALFLVYLGLR
jgi:undecaprenyl-diphosphatase